MSEGAPPAKAEVSQQDAPDEAKAEVGQSHKKLPTTQVVHEVCREGGEGGEATAESDDEQRAVVGAESCRAHHQPQEQPDEKGAQEVDAPGRPWGRPSEELCCPPANKVSEEAP